MGLSTPFYTYNTTGELGLLLENTAYHIKTFEQINNVSTRRTNYTIMHKSLPYTLVYVLGCIVNRKRLIQYLVC